MRKKRHFVLIEIECLDNQGPVQARDRVHRWIEHYGYTDCSFGFKFKTTAPVTGGKRLIPIPKENPKWSKVS